MSEISNMADHAVEVDGATKVEPASGVLRVTQNNGMGYLANRLQAKIFASSGCNGITSHAAS